MEPRFGHDFGHVQVHEGAQANESAEALGARAYTVGHHIVVADGELSPATMDGQQLLAHELTHVVQRGAADGSHAEKGKARRSPESRALNRTDDPLEAEADATANRVVEGSTVDDAIPGNGQAVRSGHAVPAIQRKEGGKPQKNDKVPEFTVERDHGRRGSYLIYFPHPRTRDEVIGILFIDGRLPQGIQLEDAGVHIQGWAWKFAAASGEIDAGTYASFSPEFQKRFSPGVVMLTEDESAAYHAREEAFLDSRPTYLGGPSVREAMHDCKEHKSGTDFETRCWGKRAGFYYYIGPQAGYTSRVLEVRTAPESEHINKDWEWWLNQGYSLHDAAQAEEELQLAILKQLIFAYVSALSAAPGALRRPTLPPSALRQVGAIGAKGIQTYEAWKMASGKDTTETDMLLMGLAGAFEMGMEFLGSPTRPRGPAAATPPTPEPPVSPEGALSATAEHTAIPKPELHATPSAQPVASQPSRAPAKAPSPVTNLNVYRTQQAAIREVQEQQQTAIKHVQQQQAMASGKVANENQEMKIAMGQNVSPTTQGPGAVTTASAPGARTPGGPSGRGSVSTTGTSGGAQSARTQSPRGTEPRRATITSIETRGPGGTIEILSEGRVGDAPASRPGLEKKYPLGERVGLTGWVRFHLEGIKAIGDELNVVYAESRFNISETALIENQIRAWRDEIRVTGGELYYTIRARCHIHTEFEGVTIKVLDEITWKIERRLPGTDEFETLFEHTGTPPASPPPLAASPGGTSP